MSLNDYFETVKRTASGTEKVYTRRMSYKNRSRSKELNTQFEPGFAKVSGGTKLRIPRDITSKLLFADKPDVIVRMDDIANQQQQYGNKLITSQRTGAMNNTFAANDVMPIRMFELTAIPVLKADVGNTGVGSIVQPYFGYTIDLDSDKTPRVSEIQTTASQYNVWEKGVGDSTGWNDSNMGTYKKVFMRWVEARLNLYQVKKVPLKYTLMLVRFKDRQLVPEQIKVGGQISMSNSAKNFYTRLIKPYINGSITSSDATLLRNGMEVLQKKTIIMPEKNDSDSDYIKKTQVVMRYNLDRICSFEWSNGLVQATTNIAVPITSDPEAGIVRNIVWNDRLKPENRVYLIVLCDSIYHRTDVNGTCCVTGTTAGTPAGYTPDYTQYNGSIDIVCRAKYNPL